ncbi:hypothetical protein Tco_0252593 [Tanacetum coccineum]
MLALSATKLSMELDRLLNCCNSLLALVSNCRFLASQTTSTLDVQLSISKDSAFRLTEGSVILVMTMKFAPQLHESAGGLLKTKLVSHSCSLAGSTSAMEVSIPIASVLPGRVHECNESFKLGRPPALS